MMRGLGAQGGKCGQSHVQGQQYRTLKHVRVMLDFGEYHKDAHKERYIPIDSTLLGGSPDGLAERPLAIVKNTEHGRVE